MLKNQQKPLSWIEELNVAELNDLKNKIDFLLYEKQKTDKDLKLQQFYDVVQEVLSEKLKTNKVSYTIFKRQNNFNKFKKSYKDLDVYMKKIGVGSKKATHYKFYFLFVKLLINWLQQCKVPVSMNTITNNIDKIPGLLDQAYPNYIENNLIHLIK